MRDRATWTPVGGASGGNVLHGEDITEGLEYLVPDNVGDVVAFRSTMDSAQVPAEQEGFGFLAKVNGSESIALLVQNDPDNPNSGRLKIFTGRVQNDGSGTDWQELASDDEPFSGFKRINRTGVQYVETSNNYDFSVFLNKVYRFTDLEGKKLYLDMELVGGTPSYYTTAPLPVEMVTIQSHWVADNVCVYSAMLNTPTNGKITLLLHSISNPNAIGSISFTVIGSGLSGALKINGIYVK